MNYILKNGIDVIWETIGGKLFETLLKHIAVKGRLVIIGGTEGYKTIGFPDVSIGFPDIPSYIKVFF
jgi:prostaglandin reductase 3